MSAAELLTDLGRAGIRLEADGERLRYYPRSALTPDLLGRLKGHKAELLAMLRPALEAAPDSPGSKANAPDGLGIDPVERPAEGHRERFPLRAIRCESLQAVCRCGGTTWRDVTIHGGQSMRRDCGRCGRFQYFLVWYGKDTRQNG